MDNLIVTIIIAVALMLLVVSALGVGFLLTGKNRLKKGCGMRPKDDPKGSCPCGRKEPCDKEEEE